MRMKRKKRTITTTEFRPHFIRPEITIGEARAILCEDGEEFSDQEIKEITFFLLNLVEIHYTSFKEKQSTKALNSEKDLGKIVSINIINVRDQF